MSWGISPDFSGLSPCYRQIAYALLTRAPVAARSIATPAMPLDLHVLGLSLAFILSQDQTLRCISRFISFFYLRRSPGRNWLRYFFPLYYTCFFPVFSMNFTPADHLPVGAIRSAKVLQSYTLFPFPSKFFSIFFPNFFLKNSGFIVQPFYFLSVIIYYNFIFLHKNR